MAKLSKQFPSSSIDHCVSAPFSISYNHPFSRFPGLRIREGSGACVLNMDDFLSSFPQTRPQEWTHAAAPDLEGIFSTIILQEQYLSILLITIQPHVTGTLLVSQCSFLFGCLHPQNAHRHLHTGVVSSTEPFCSPVSSHSPMICHRVRMMDWWCILAELLSPLGKDPDLTLISNKWQLKNTWMDVPFSTSYQGLDQGSWEDESVPAPPPHLRRGNSAIISWVSLEVSFCLCWLSVKVKTRSQYQHSHSGNCISLVSLLKWGS